MLLILKLWAHACYAAAFNGIQENNCLRSFCFIYSQYCERKSIMCQEIRSSTLFEGRVPVLLDISPISLKVPAPPQKRKPVLITVSICLSVCSLNRNVCILFQLLRITFVMIIRECTLWLWSNKNLVPLNTFLALIMRQLLSYTPHVTLWK